MALFLSGSTLRVCPLNSDSELTVALKSPHCINLHKTVRMEDIQKGTSREEFQFFFNVVV